MFGSGMTAVDGSGGSSGGSSGSILVPRRFVWPYGGNKVFLCGSFTRWVEHIPLTPVEGCPNVFQVIYSLAPGYHQYKFFVDGEWRHDELEPFVSGNYGLVNTVYITGVPDMLNPPVPPAFPVRSNMDVDNDITMHAEDNLATPEEAIEVSRQRISSFLSSHAAYELLPDSGKVIALDVNLPVKQAFHILYEQGVPVAPLWDLRLCQFVGVLSAMDFVLILRELGTRGSILTQEELETHTIAAWKEEKQHIHGRMDGIGRSLLGGFIHAGPNDSLKDVTLKILQNKLSTVPIIYSSPLEGSLPQLLHLASLSGILKCICRHFKHSASSLPILQQSISSIPLGTWVPNIGQTSGRPLAMLRPNASLKSALTLLIQAEVSSVPVVDDNDSLLDIYSRSDITALARDEAYTQIHIEETSIQRTLQLGLDLNSPYNGQKCQMCLRTDSLHKVMERLANPGVRRLVVVEAGSKRVEGIISLSDLFRFLLG